MNKKLLLMIQIALVAAVICVISPFAISIPISPVPISLSLLAIMLGVYVLGWKYGTLSVALYILIGAVGIPVFANFKAGVSVLVGVTGGYIVGYILAAVIAGLFIDKFEKKLYMHAIGMVLGILACYALGTVWMYYSFLGGDNSKSIGDVLSLAVIPYIPADAVKIVIALVVGPQLRKAIKKINNNVIAK